MGTGLVVCCLTRVLSNSKNASSGPGESGGVAMTFDPGHRLNCRKPQDLRREPSLPLPPSPPLSLSLSLSLFHSSLPLFPFFLYPILAEGHTIMLGPIVIVRSIARVSAIDLVARNRSVSPARSRHKVCRDAELSLSLSLSSVSRFSLSLSFLSLFLSLYLSISISSLRKL